MKRILAFAFILSCYSLFCVSGEKGLNLYAGPVLFPDDPPVAHCQDVTVSASDSCITVVTPGQVDNGSYDPDADSLIFTLTPEGPFGPGEYEVILTVTDTTGLFDQCAAIITVVDDSIPMVITHSLDLYLDSEGQASIAAGDLDAGSEDNCGIDTLSLDVYVFSCAQLGENLVTLFATDYAGNISSSTDTVTVFDTIAPVLTVIDGPLVLWPPNHEYETFDVSDFIVDIWDNCPITEDQVRIFHATSDEPENSNGDGNTVDDIVIADDCQSISLRKERQGGSNGRVYTVYLALDDENGQADTAMCQVYVPHNQGSTPVDDGEAYEVIAECDAISGLPGKDELSASAEPQLSNYPNPFTGSTVVKVSLAETGPVKLSVYDLDGVLVGQLFDGILAAGEHEFLWDAKVAGKTERNKGVYLVRLVERDKPVIRRIIKM